MGEEREILRKWEERRLRNRELAGIGDGEIVYADVRIESFYAKMNEFARSDDV